MEENWYIGERMTGLVESHCGYNLLGRLSDLDTTVHYCSFKVHSRAANSLGVYDVNQKDYRLSRHNLSSLARDLG